MLEASSPLARRWLSVIPSSPSDSLSNHEVSCGLQYRSLYQTKSNLTCNACHKSYYHGHHETCEGGLERRAQRHNEIQRHIAWALRTVRGVSVQLEPTMGSDNSRNDIHIRTSPPSTLPPADVDTTIHSLAARLGSSSTHRPVMDIPFRTVTVPSSPNWSASIVKHSTSVLDGHTRAWADVKYKKANDTPDYTDRAIFAPLVMTSGGYMDSAATKLFDEWKLHLSPGIYTRLCSAISICLARNRAIGMRWD